MNISSTIQHIVIIPADKNSAYSFFQGFSRQILTGYEAIFECLALAPHDILEFLDNEPNCIRSKTVSSSLDIYIITEDLIDDAPFDFKRCFTAIWTTDSITNNIISFKKKFIHDPLLFITSVEHKNISLFNYDVNSLDEAFMIKVKKFIDSKINNELAFALTRRFNSERKKDNLLNFKPIAHNVVLPMIRAIESYSYKKIETKELAPSEKNDQYILAMKKLTRLIQKIRNKYDVKNLSPDVKNDRIIFCPSMYVELYSKDHNKWKQTFRIVSKQSRQLLSRIIIKNKGYSNASINLSKDDKTTLLSPAVSMLIREFKQERKLFTDIVSILAANQFVPALRFPSSIMSYHSKLRHIISLLNQNQDNFTLSKAVLEYGETLKTDLGNELLELSFSDTNKIMAICDLPIEWISINNIPIAFTHEISKICPTPGNLFAKTVLSRPIIDIPYSAFKNVLVISSFKDDDKIRHHLKDATESTKKNDITLEFVVIENKNELISALNSFKGAIVIFDCHGDHNGAAEDGWINIGNECISTWGLNEYRKIPPIVILSACFTQPINGSHATVASGFIQSGAYSVIGTYGPIDAIHAATFIKNLLFQIVNTVPILIKNRVITWREIFSDSLKISYLLDVVNGFIEEKLISSAQSTAILEEITISINYKDTEWTKNLKAILAFKSNKTINEINEVLKNRFQFVETMLYCNIGRPENIWILNDSI